MPALTQHYIMLARSESRGLVRTITQTSLVAIIVLTPVLLTDKMGEVGSNVAGLYCWPSISIRLMLPINCGPTGTRSPFAQCPLILRRSNIMSDRDFDAGEEHLQILDRNHHIRVVCNHSTQLI
ncbi:hypothetical protein BAUCODRAFT_293999 [Baudoinia panamericana UAMH 10762]|uniref:Uncharacterized protein n=1 Tax=Baudoinia panamericana (strain UAMH 10762) TaxID=717646 RepID=M2M846_BAUPA|nr:uncharacterized protein BAUCODRAFT_293999 [Baudoinia panamericana UAMH 10762]EMC92506.1 hypothetical protein BAUCODRAFT_293999 [Baudoinia panamericana UAMH 10762]